MAASNYNLTLMTCGVIGLTLASILSLVSFLFGAGSLSNVFHTLLSNIPTTVLITLCCVQMFSTSFIEEEHNFWYWMASAWFFITMLKE